MKTKGFFIIPVVVAVAFSTLVALLLFSQSAKAYAQAINLPPLGGFLVEPPDGVMPLNAIESTLIFTDPGVLDTALTYSWVWGDDKTSTCEKSEGCSIDFNAGNIIGTHAYEEPGVYTVQLTVSEGDVPIALSIIYEYLIAYDPSAGFVTGGGWIMSPEGACQFEACTNDTTGKATFGFVSKYKKGATAPTGNTEFQFHAADLNFHSSSYEWLLVTGSNYARFKGVGTINGQGEYKFMIWAGDGEPDTFRIKIWQEDEFGVENKIYDNDRDQAIGGGSIVVHTKK
jgi:hypothetical protein